MKDLGPAEPILGLRGFRQWQLLYLARMSKMDDPKDDTAVNSMKAEPYSSACGCMMYDVVSTRPNIAYAMGVVSRLMVKPVKPHWEAIKPVTRDFKRDKRQTSILWKQSRLAWIL